MSPRPAFNRYKRYNSRRDDTYARINRSIRAPKVRLIDDAGNQVGVVDLDDALKKAAEKELDLVEVASGMSPPVCRIMDYAKYKYDQKKKKKLARKKQHVTHLKEVRYNPKIEDHDYQVKLRHVREFLVHKDKVRVQVRFRGRENVHKELGAQLLQRIARDAADVGEMESSPKSLGRTMVMILVPRS